MRQQKAGGGFLYVRPPAANTKFRGLRKFVTLLDGLSLMKGWKTLVSRPFEH
jgi:hypothetical protein